MKIRAWIALAITYVLGVSMVVLVSHILNRMLQMSLMDEYITTGLGIFAATVGMVIGIIVFLAKRKK